MTESKSWSGARARWSRRTTELDSAIRRKARRLGYLVQRTRRGTIREWMPHAGYMLIECEHGAAVLGFQYEATMTEKRRPTTVSTISFPSCCRTGSQDVIRHDHPLDSSARCISEPTEEETARRGETVGDLH
jgi:hypothetical protein